MAEDMPTIVSDYIDNQNHYWSVYPLSDVHWFGLNIYDVPANDPDYIVTRRQTTHTTDAQYTFMDQFDLSRLMLEEYYPDHVDVRKEIAWHGIVKLPLQRKESEPYREPPPSLRPHRRSESRVNPYARPPKDELIIPDRPSEAITPDRSARADAPDTHPIQASPAPEAQTTSPSEPILTQRKLI